MLYSNGTDVRILCSWFTQKAIEKNGAAEVKEVRYFLTNALLVRNFEKCKVMSHF